jgi:hypothetical protein
MLIKEKNGSYTVNVNGGEVTMSTRNFGMVGKSYKTASEAFKDSDYANAIEMPEKAEYDYIWAILGVLVAIGFMAWISSRF